MWEFCSDVAMRMRSAPIVQLTAVTAVAAEKIVCKKFVGQQLLLKNFARSKFLIDFVHFV